VPSQSTHTPQINNNPATFYWSDCPKPVNTYPPDKRQSTYFLLKWLSQASQPIPPDKRQSTYFLLKWLSQASQSISPPHKQQSSYFFIEVTVPSQSTHTPQINDNPHLLFIEVTVPSQSTHTPQINDNPLTFYWSDCPKPVKTNPPNKTQPTYFLLKWLSQASQHIPPR
jgi:hypothetical protein